MDHALEEPAAGIVGGYADDLFECSLRLIEFKIVELIDAFDGQRMDTRPVGRLRGGGKAEEEYEEKYAH
ncbi:MAG: hypothetical protein A2X67_10245 [Ignavibacteria bacterium GWA2_55_11]|nr:MAG: hypothetical protein A2X67_10245 [Ignavibacteria bacterium GWA2_55_11]OGU66291.1 MAG: hypothetical protein A3C56_09925 [Ignavibacteria bacterium RIFCSPHIGHO2_02_FULL_56_12]OGU70982.1 MAG: hypothetical protein A3H45_12580 [Ignavibacteria bacterium RIFCSPLOWO2_02_FULL_55_14]